MITLKKGVGIVGKLLFMYYFVEIVSPRYNNVEITAVTKRTVFDFKNKNQRPEKNLLLDISPIHTVLAKVAAYTSCAPAFKSIRAHSEIVQPVV